MSAQPPFLSILETAEYLGTRNASSAASSPNGASASSGSGDPIRIPMSAIEEFVTGGTVQPRNRRAI